MKIDSENAKLAFYGIAAIAVFAIGYSIYSKVKSTGGTISDIGNAIDASISETIRTVKNTVLNMSDSVSGFAQQFTGDREFVGEQGKGAYELTVDEYDPSTLAFIKADGKGSPSDYKVFSNGVIIDPYGNYKQMDFSNVDMSSIDGYAVKDIWQNPRYAFGKIYPMSGDLLEESKSVYTQQSVSDRNRTLIQEELKRVPTNSDQAEILRQELAYVNSGGQYLPN